jgi:hypothetical protein
VPTFVDSRWHCHALPCFALCVGTFAGIVGKAAAAVDTTPQLRKISAVVKGEPWFAVKKKGSAQYVSLQVDKMLPHIISSHHQVTATAASSASDSHVRLLPTLHELLKYVQQRKWHATSQQIDVALRAMATHLILQAHGYQRAGLPERDIEVSTTWCDYSTLLADAGKLLPVAWRFHMQLSRHLAT